MRAEIDCKEVSRLISAGLDRDLPKAEKDRLHLHFAICSKCRTVNAQFDFLRRAMRKMEPGGGQEP